MASSPAAPREADRALSASGRKLFQGKQRRRAIGETQPLQARDREEGRVDLSVLDFLQTSLDIAAKQRRHKVGSPALHLRGAAQRGGSDDGACGKRIERETAARYPGVARILSRQIAGDDDFARQMRRQILRGMHGEIDRAGDER